MTVLFSYGFVARQLRKPNRFRKKYRQSNITLRLAILFGVTRDVNSEKIITSHTRRRLVIGMSVKSA